MPASGSGRSTSTLPPSSPPPPSSDALVAEAARYKRLYESSLKANGQGGAKRRQDEPPRTQKLGRGIRRIVDLFEDVEDIVRHADEYEVAEDNVSSDEESADGDLDDDSRREEREEREERRQERRVRKRAHRSVEILSQLIPKFREKIDNAEPEELVPWYKDLQSGGNNARSDDIHKLTPKVADWVNLAEEPTPLIHPASRENRGLQHDLCGKLLSPVDCDWEDPIIRAKIRNFEAGFELSSSARALYANFTGDPRNLEVGFLKSKLLVKTYKCIFTSPSSANDVNLGEDSDQENVDHPPVRRRTSSKSHKSVRKDVAGTLHMDHKVTPRAIAYTAVQLLFALSSAPSWTHSHQGLSFIDCYYYIVHFFEGFSDDDLESKKTAQDLLKWWNRQIFPEARPTAVKSGAKRAFDALAQQRAARKRKNQSTARS
ncbi:hypothetical protein EST38_g13229 [Candolleomyces aberdarensis]|uniref:Uncharacterized protein n=1 Tax=Candolleomyces aberdarensis TaxID=2316362 RepID=A0A4Q2D2D6_9AGAR|nr:hypothetical protein EST38_g13229 [Candolleomyces aberdarensis]